MSRGPGKVERAIIAAFECEPENAFTTEELCARVYRGLNRIEKKHRVAVIRAGKRLVARELLGVYGAERQGGELVFFDPFNVMSYAMARLRADFVWNGTPSDMLRTLLAPDGKKRDLIESGGAWWRHTQERIARRDGDHARADELRAIGQARLADAFGRLGAARP